MLQFVLGRAGCGKTEYVFNKINALVNDGESNILLLIPEQYSFVSERRLLTELGESRVNCVENTSFSRLSNDVAKKYGNEKLPLLSKGAKAVLFKKACEQVKDNLQLFSKNVDQISFINSAISIYDEMKSCRVTSQDIMDASAIADSNILSAKLNDISLIMTAYDNLIADKYIDPACELSHLYERLCTVNYFKDRTVFIDGFTGFVAQEYKIIEVILGQAKNVYITFCTDSYNNSDKFDLFSYVNSNIAILKGLAQKAGVEIPAPVILSTPYRFKKEELAYIEKYAFSNIKNIYPESSNNVHTYSAKTISDECDYVSSNIIRLLRNGCRASDITVICRDMSKYQSEMLYSFSKFNVPCFDDERQNISSQPLIMFVNFLLRTVMYSLRSDDIFSMLKTGLTDLDSESVSALENYSFLWNINGSRWKEDFVNSTKGFSHEIDDKDKRFLDSLNTSRKYVIDKLVSFSKSVRKKTITNICKTIYYTLIDFSVDKNLTKLAVQLDNNGSSYLAAEQGRVWDLLMEILDKLATIDIDEKITIKEFYKLFNLMLSNEDLGTLPSGLDNVQFGCADRIRCDNPKYVFVIGANEGEFPRNYVASGLLSDSDRIALINSKFKLYSYGDALNAQERYFAYMAVSSASDGLYVSYQHGKDDAAGSSIVRGIKSCVPMLDAQTYDDSINIDGIESVSKAFEILASNYENNIPEVATLKKYFSEIPEYNSRIEAVNRLVKNEDISISDRDLATALFKKDMYLSASRIEDYYNCPFRYFCKFGLGARPRQKAEMDSMQTGIVIHFVLEKIIKEHSDKGFTNLTDSDIVELVNEYLKEYLCSLISDKETLTSRFKYRFLRLSNMMIFVVKRLRDEFAHSDFEPKAFEINIGNGDNNEPVKSSVIQLSDGGSIQIKGAIDRVDTFTENGKQYVRVVDYKSGNKQFSMSDILYGLNLQMFIYLFTLCKSEHELSGIASGVLYMHSSRDAHNVNRTTIQKDVESADKKAFSMKGVVLNDEENQIAQRMDYELKGDYIPVSVKSGKLSGNIVTLSDLGRISKKIDSLIEDMGLNLHSGLINQNPVNGTNHDKTCEFCDYRDVCINRKEIFSRDIEKISNDEVINKLKEEYNGN